MSKKNERDLQDVPEEVRKDLEFQFVEKVTELLEAVFTLPKVPSAPRIESPTSSYDGSQTLV